MKVTTLIYDLIKRCLSIPLLRFAAVGALNSLFGYGIFALCLYMGLHYSLSVFIGTVLGIFFNFKTYGHLVFNNVSNHLIFRFTAVYFFLYICNVGGLALLEQWGIDPYYGGMILLVPIGLLGYVLNKLFVYKVNHHQTKKL